MALIVSFGKVLNLRIHKLIESYQGQIQGWGMQGTSVSSSTHSVQNYAKIPADIAATSPICCERITFSALVWLVAIVIWSRDAENWHGLMFAHVQLAQMCIVPSPLNSPASAPAYHP